jgi:hypothetical protein
MSDLTPVFRRWRRLPKILPIPMFVVKFSNRIISYCHGSIAPRPTHKLEDHPLLVARGSSFNIFLAIFRGWRLSPLSATRRQAMPWRQGTHVTCPLDNLAANKLCYFGAVFVWVDVFTGIPHAKVSSIDEGGVQAWCECSWSFHISSWRNFSVRRYGHSFPFDL